MIYIYTLLAYIIFPAVAVFVRINHESGLTSGFVGFWVIVFGLIDLLKLYALVQLFI